MHVLALYDIHGNFEALDAVLGDPRVASPDAIAEGDDVVPGPFAAVTLDRLDTLSVPRPWVLRQLRFRLRNAHPQGPRRRLKARSSSAPALLAGLLALSLAALGAPANAADPTQRTVLIGRSVRGRPITARVIGPDSAPRKILIVGCIHGNECAGETVLSALAHSPPGVGVQLWLVPEMNPDGSAADTRQNAHGVDLNRNFPYQWRPISDPTFFAGPKPLSEPESRAAVKLIRRLKPAVTIWYHQHEDLVDMAGGDRGIARRYAHLAGLRATCLPFLPGTATAWSNHTLPTTTAFVVELPAGPVRGGALTRHLKAVRAVERGEREGSRSQCTP